MAIFKLKCVIHLHIRVRIIYYTGNKKRRNTQRTTVQWRDSNSNAEYSSSQSGNYFT